MIEKKVEWTEFKAFVAARSLVIQEVENRDDVYRLGAICAGMIFRCDLVKSDPAGTDQADYQDNFQPTANRAIKNRVITATEEGDKVLKLASAEADFNPETDEAVIEVLVPGTFNGFDPDVNNGRFVAGGYGFTDQYKFGDRCTKVEVVDIDNVLGMGAGTVLKQYHDSDVAEANQGWRMYAALQNQGEIEIDPMGGYGFLPSGLYLRIVFKRATASPAAKVAVDIWWGKRE